MSMITGDVLTYTTPETISLSLDPGQYKFQCWGAQGGYRSGASYGGKGGYAEGTLTLSKPATIYIVVGGAGGVSNTNSNNVKQGGYNGGGYRYGFPGGGGASDIRIEQDSYYARVIVAGGGGSCGAASKAGGYGGGTAGQARTDSYGTHGEGGNQKGFTTTSVTAATSQHTTNANTSWPGGFGFGGFGVSVNSGYAGAGGGGWYGGCGAVPDSGGDDDRGGGGGSGFVYTSSSAANVPSGWLLDASYYLTETKLTAGNASMPKVDGTGNETGHSGDGAVKITAIEVTPQDVFGVCWDYSNPSTQLSRLSQATDPNGYIYQDITTGPSPAIGDGAGNSPFDAFAPWNGMEEYNIADGTLGAKQGEAGFSRANDTVVKIPEFYYKIMDDAANSKRYFYISKDKIAGFFLHPGSGCYIARYMSGGDGVSRAGSEPFTSTARGEARDKMKTKGRGWSLCSYQTWCAIWLLYLVEYADWDSQAKIGTGLTNLSSSNAAGGTDSMIYHTGRAAGANGKAAIQYRHIENLWGNLGQWIDGINFNNSIIYTCADPMLYADSTSVCYTKGGTRAETDGFISAISNADWAFYPIETTGSETMFIPDYQTVAEGWQPLAIGGSDDESARNGLFSFDTRANHKAGARAQFRVFSAIEEAPEPGTIKENLGKIALRLPSSVYSYSGLKVYLNNMMYRGNDLLAADKFKNITTLQRNVEAGNLVDIYVGDYLAVDSMKYIVMGINTYKGSGVVESNKNHLVLVPEHCIGQEQMNINNSCEAGYAGSQIFTTLQNEAWLGKLMKQFDYHILSGTWTLTIDNKSHISKFATKIRLLNEAAVFGNTTNGTYADVGEMDSQLPGFALKNTLKVKNWNGAAVLWWLSTTEAVGTSFSQVDASGNVTTSVASASAGIVPMILFG